MVQMGWVWAGRSYQSGWASIGDLLNVCVILDCRMSRDMHVVDGKKWSQIAVNMLRPNTMYLKINLIHFAIDRLMRVLCKFPCIDKVDRSLGEGSKHCMIDIPHCG